MISNIDHNHNFQLKVYVTINDISITKTKETHWNWAKPIEESKLDFVKLSIQFLIDHCTYQLHPFTTSTLILSNSVNAKTISMHFLTFPNFDNHIWCVTWLAYSTTPHYGNIQCFFVFLGEAPEEAEWRGLGWRSFRRWLGRHGAGICDNCCVVTTHFIPRWVGAALVSIITSVTEDTEVVWEA